jgi:K+-transporting ATPase ATPase C chain
MLLVLTMVICSVIYPAVLLGIGQTVFPNHANGSLIDKSGRPATSEKDAVGSRLIAQPFTGDEYFQPRPSAASYNGAASGASNWAANNYLLRERVARQLGPIVKYQGGAKKGQLVGPDIEVWFSSKPELVARWAETHPTVAQNWVKADKLNADYVAIWQREHAKEVEAWKKSNPGTPEPKPEDLAVPFFTSYAKTFPGTWPIAVEHKMPDGKTEKRIEPVKEGTDIQGIFFDMWRQEHPQVALENVPADMVMASGSGLDPHITLQNARYQLDRVAQAWSKKLNADPARVRSKIEGILADKQHAPLGGLAGVPLVNVLEVNLALSTSLHK